MEGAWWTFFKWLKDSSLWLSSGSFWLFKFVITHSAIQLSAALFRLFVALLWSVIYPSLHSVYVQLIVKLFRSVIYYTLHSVYVQWVIKWTKISLACTVVLQDPICQALHHQAKLYDVRCRILFDCQFPMLYNILNSLALRRYWSRQVPCAKSIRTQGFYLRLRLPCEHEVGPSVLDRGAHAPLADGLRVGAHGLKDAHSGSYNCVPRDVVMAHGKELELGLASPEAFNGLGWIPGSAEGCDIRFQLISCDCGIGCNQVLEHVSGMDTSKVQKVITEMPKEDIVDVVQDERPDSVHGGNNGAELFQVSVVLVDHDSSEGSTCVGGNHKRLDWWDRVDPSNSVGDGQALGTFSELII